MHFGNVLFDGGEITGLIDFDVAVKAPKYMNLLKLIGIIDQPSQFVEGTKYFSLYENQKFEFLYPVLKNKMSDVFADSNLEMKVNLVGIMKGLGWVAENWSAEWNKDMIDRILETELAEGEDLKKTYFGQIIANKLR